jgi:hypothetical protein
MRKLMLLAAGAMVLYEAAKYFKINSVEDVKKLIPQLKGLVSA